MAKIHKLSYHEAQKIAAGEVVERPANVVKELIENALDAGATTISVFIEDGGKALIRVVDNGCGMSPEDAHLCFEHHATSKITTVNDLETIATFGFRGEALSSIASVSRITLTTNENTADAGIKLEREGNVLMHEQQVAAPRGTDFIVRDIFYNVPARLKFLKKRETELNQIHTLFQAYSLAYPQLHWHFASEGATLHNCAPTDTVQQRMEQLFDQRLTQALIPCSYTTKDSSVQIEGVITDNTYARYDRSDIFFFVNQRWIKNQPLARALLKGYANTLPAGRFPAACLFITVATGDVDINVHPRKEEVLFLHPKNVEKALYSMVESALGQGLSNRLHSTTRSADQFYQQPNLFHQASQAPRSVAALQPETFMRAPYTARHEPLFFTTPQSESAPHAKKTLETFQHNSESLSASEMLFTPKMVESGMSTKALENAPRASTSPEKIFDTELSEAPLNIKTPLQSHSPESLFEAYAEVGRQQEIIPPASAYEEPMFSRHTILGQLHKAYIMLEHPDGLYMVDQHAAHERIIYERLAQHFEDAASVQLLFPIIVSIGAENSKKLLPHVDILHQFGIGIEEFSPTEVIIKTTPVHAQTVDYTELVRTIIGWIYDSESLEKEDVARQLHEKLRAQIACKAAIKAGDELTREQMEQLLKDLAATPHGFSCPHGRPTGWLLGTYEIEKRFRRKQ